MGSLSRIGLWKVSLAMRKSAQANDWVALLHKPSDSEVAQVSVSENSLNRLLVLPARLRSVRLVAC